MAKGREAYKNHLESSKELGSNLIFLECVQFQERKWQEIRPEMCAVSRSGKILRDLTLSPDDGDAGDHGWGRETGMEEIQSGK